MTLVAVALQPKSCDSSPGEVHLVKKRTRVAGQAQSPRVYQTALWRVTEYTLPAVTTSGFLWLVLLRRGGGKVGLWGSIELLEDETDMDVPPT